MTGSGSQGALGLEQEQEPGLVPGVGVLRLHPSYLVGVLGVQCDRKAGAVQRRGGQPRWS